MNYENMLTLKVRLGSFDAGAILDVAVGRGEFLKFALGSFRSWKSAAGIDNDPDMLQAAIPEFSNSPVILIQGSALLMPFINQYFDTITLSNALHHIENLPLLFTETARVCKSRGLLIINEMINDNAHLEESYSLYHRLVSEIDHQLGRYHREPFTLKELLAIIKSANFQLLDYFTHAEVTGDKMDPKEIEAIASRLKKKLAMLRGTDYFYFYENKVQEIISRLQRTGVQRPRHVAFMLKVS